MRQHAKIANNPQCDLNLPAQGQKLENDTLLQEKIALLKKNVGDFAKAALAFSGGVDSTFLAKICFEVLGDNALAITADTPFMARSEMAEAHQMAQEIGIRHQVVQLSDIGEEILANPKDRCYWCKTAVFKKLWEITKTESLGYLLDGTNLDDLDDYRPGLKALSELEVKSPLQEAGFTKHDIRLASKSMGLPTWEKPSLACLASRIPYDQPITTEKLGRVEKAEEFLREKGIVQLRVRDHQEIARIEVSPEERAKFFSAEFLDETSNYLQKLGFRYVTLDMEGYRTGKLN